jgi:hypothetical protein
MEPASRQREAALYRGLGTAQKIRMRLGASPNMMEAFPDKPKGMHWRTYDRLRRRPDLAKARSMMGLMRYVDSRRAHWRVKEKPRSSGA